MKDSEPTEIRIGAFVILRDAIPSYVTLQTIMHCVHNERTSQLRTLMYTSLVSMAKYTGAGPQRKRLYVAICRCSLRTLHALCSFIGVIVVKSEIKYMNQYLYRP